MSKTQKSRQSLCGNCKHFVVGGLCELVKGQIKAKDTCDLHEYGRPQTIDTQVDPAHNKLDVNYKPGFMVETTTSDLIQKAIQMEHELLSRGIPENEVHRAVIAYFSQREPPYAMPWPGPITGLDLAAPINNMIVLDTGTPLTNFDGLPQNREPYPTSSINPYPNNPTPDPNSVGSLSNTYDILNPPYPGDDTNWTATSSKINSQPSMHGEHGFNVEKTIPEWRYPIEQSQMYPLQIPDLNIPPSGINPLAEAQKNKKKDWKSILAKWAILLGGATVIDSILRNYLDSGIDGEPPEKPLRLFAEYVYHGHDSDDNCYPYNGKTFDLLETHNRPVIPSENLGYTTSHPNCKCTWNITPNYSKSPDSITRKEESEIHSIENHIDKAAKDGTLHKVKKDGKLSNKTTSKNPLKESSCSCQNLKIPNTNLDLPKNKAKVGSFWLQRKAFKEALTNLRSEFKWINDEYISKAKELAENNDGVLYLVRAARESITDHRAEGEPYRRKLAADELSAMTRTGIAKGMDVNHQPEFRTDATILDAEFDPMKKEIQMLVMERDPQINEAINNGIITAVSINGGMPRSESVEPCDHGCTNNCELCVVPRGVVLGELDDIAMTWVVTDPNGMYWNGNYIASAEPGIKVTKIEIL